MQRRKHLSSPSPKKTGVVSLTGKMMASVSWNGLFLGRISHTINEECLSNLVRVLRKAIKTKRLEHLIKGVVFQQGHDPAHVSFVSMATVHVVGFELLDYFPYPLDLVTSSNHLLSNMKIHLAGNQLQDIQALSHLQDSPHPF